jgi:hypothetical protein
MHPQILQRPPIVELESPRWSSQQMMRTYPKVVQGLTFAEKCTATARIASAAIINLAKIALA